MTDNLQPKSRESVRLPRVSVILPTYNRQQFVADAIASVLAQDFTDLELIVVDDGSTDGTAEFLAGLADPRLQVISQANAGRSRARNVALQQMRGEYVAFLDSDDLYLPGKLTRQVAYLDQHPEAGMVYTSARCIDADGNPLGQRYDASRSGRIYKDVAFFRPVTITLPTVMVRRAVIEDVGPFDEAMERFEDTDMWRRISRRTVIHALQEDTCLLRTHADNRLEAQNPDVIIAAIAYYTAKIMREDRHVTAPWTRLRGISSLYIYYGQAFMMQPEWEKRGRELLATGYRYWPAHYWVPFLLSVPERIARRAGILPRLQSRSGVVRAMKGRQSH